MMNLEGRRGQLQVRARGGRGGVPPARPRLAVRAPRQRGRVAVVPRASLQAARAIGSIADLDAATLADVVAFHATLLPARQRDPDRRRRLRPGRSSMPGSTSTSGRSRGRRAAAALRRQRAGLAEPTAASPSTGPQVPLPAVAFTWLAPPVTQRRCAGAAGRGGGARGRRIVAPQPGAGLPAADRDAGQLRRRPARRPRPADRERDRRRRQVDRRRARRPARRGAAAGERRRRPRPSSTR